MYGPILKTQRWTVKTNLNKNNPTLDIMCYTEIKDTVFFEMKKYKTALPDQHRSVYAF